MNQTQTPLEAKLAAAAVTDAFRQAVADYSTGRPQDRIELTRASLPPVKVQRFLTKLLEELADHPIESLRLSGVSGCSNFTGQAVVQPGNLTIDYDWDCAWKADQEGMTSFGFPDQQRAAREFGYDCFRIFDIQGAEEA